MEQTLARKAVMGWILVRQVAVGDMNGGCGTG